MAHSTERSMNNLGVPIVSSVEGEEAGNMAGETGWGPMGKDLTCYAKELGPNSIGGRDLSLTVEQFLNYLWSNPVLLACQKMYS